MKFFSFLISALLASAAVHAAAPVSLIFDTDMGNDVDDALALGLIHALQTRGECRLLAVTLTNPDPTAGDYIAAVDAFYGRETIPIGVNPNSPQVAPSRYLKVGQAQDGNGHLLYPHRYDPSTAPAALALLRRTLAAEPDHSVVIVQTGFFTNAAALLASAPDAVSPLSGRDLVARKVRLLSLMGGAFQTVNGTNRYREFNVKFDIASAKRVAADWPAPIVWSGFEIGLAVPFPADAVDHDFAYVAHHPIQEAYQLYKPTPHERPTWDVTSAFYAVFPDRGFFSLSLSGRVTVGDDGTTAFGLHKGGRDRFLIVDEKQASELKGIFAALVTQPPEHR